MNRVKSNEIKNKTKIKKKFYLKKKLLFHEENCTFSFMSICIIKQLLIIITNIWLL